MGILVSFLWNGAFFKPQLFFRADILARYAAAFSDVFSSERTKSIVSRFWRVITT